MGTTKCVAEECIAGVADVRIRTMMGEWLVYFRERYVGVIENGQLFVLDVPAARALLKDAPLIAPHAGSKPRLVVSDTSDKAFLHRLLEAVWAEVAAAGKRK